jgi:uncharacterized BrkB/YihY/UPF0761 family membrane protein
MEEESPSMFDLQIDETAQTQLKETARWSRFTGVAFIVCMGFLFLFILFFTFFKDQMSKALSQSPAFSGYGFDIVIVMIWAVVILGLVFLGLFAYLLMRFSNQTSIGVTRQDQTALENGISAFKTYLIISGVIGIISLFFGILALIKLF